MILNRKKPVHGRYEGRRHLIEPYGFLDQVQVDWDTTIAPLCNRPALQPFVLSGVRRQLRCRSTTWGQLRAFGSRNLASLQGHDLRIQKSHPWLSLKRLLIWEKKKIRLR